MRKTLIDLRRCSTRLGEYIAQFPEDKQNEADLYLELCEEIERLMEKIPQEFRE
jgi:hypothetical protein